MLINRLKKSVCRARGIWFRLCTQKAFVCCGGWGDSDKDEFISGAFNSDRVRALLPVRDFYGTSNVEYFYD